MNVHKTYANDNGIGVWITVLYGEPEKIRNITQYKSIRIDDRGTITTGKSIAGGHLGYETSFEKLDESVRADILKGIEEEEAPKPEVVISPLASPEEETIS